MGCTDVSYKIMCQRLYKKIYGNKECKNIEDIEALEDKIKNAIHDNEFYFQAGVTAMGYLSEIEEKCDEVNAYIGGLNDFCVLIGLDKYENN